MPSIARYSPASVAVRMPSARTLIGRCLHRSKLANPPAGYHTARARFRPTDLKVTMVRPHIDPDLLHPTTALAAGDRRIEPDGTFSDYEE